MANPTIFQAPGTVAPVAAPNRAQAPDESGRQPEWVKPGGRQWGRNYIPPTNPDGTLVTGHKSQGTRMGPDGKRYSTFIPNQDIPGLPKLDHQRMSSTRDYAQGQLGAPPPVQAPAPLQPANNQSTNQALSTMNADNMPTFGGENSQNAGSTPQTPANRQKNTRAPKHTGAPQGGTFGGSPNSLRGNKNTQAPAYNPGDYRKPLQVADTVL